MAPASFGYLGPLEVRLGPDVLRPRSARQRLLLCLLLVELGRTVGADRLAEELWGDDQPGDPAAALRTQISRLRRALGEAGSHLHTDPSGYRLDAGRTQVDAARFEDLVREAAQEPPEPAVELLDEALALWRGPALGEVADRPFAEAEAVRLEELRLSAREARASALLVLGEAERAAADLATLVAEHPEREPALAQLMQALYRAGRHSEALDVYRDWKQRFADELGLDPSPALRDIEQGILQHTLTDEPDEPGSPGVPAPASSFVGREDEVATIATLLEDARLVTLSGPGGVGKTRLALEVLRAAGHRYSDGVRFCDLVAVRRPTSVLRAIATAVGVAERGPRRIDDQLVAHLGRRRMLIVLDNCEHVAQPAAAIAERIVRECPNVALLVTSQIRLGVDGERVRPVAPLDTTGPDAPAVRLFVERAQAADPSFRADDEDLRAVATVCEHLDGMPLAIELAAARVRGLSVRDFETTLERRFTLLSSDFRADRRHRSLWAVVEWSYELLTAQDRAVFDRLSVFAGRFDMDAAVAVAAGDLDEEEVRRAVLHLVDRSLVVPHPNQGVMRYGLLETLRAFGLQRLEDAGELEVTRERHARWAVELSERAGAGLAGPDEHVWAEALIAGFDDLREAHAWLVGADADAGARLVCALHWFALLYSRSEVYRWAEVSAAALGDRRSPHQPSLLASVAAGAWLRGELGAAEVAARAAWEAARDMAPIQGRRAYEAMGDVLLQRGELDPAVERFRRAYQQATAAGDLLEALWDIGSIAVCLAYAGHTEEAHGPAEETLALGSTGGPSARAVGHYFRGEVAACAGEPEAADAHLKTALGLAEQVGSVFIGGLAHVTLATLHARTGDDASALASFERAIAECHRTSRWMPFWVAMRHVVDLLTRVGAHTEATTLLAAVRTAEAAPPFGEDELMLTELEKHLRETLGERAYATLWERGMALTPDEVADTALRTARRLIGALSRERTATSKTFMFTDIVSSTDLATAMGDDAWEAAMRWHDDALRPLFAAHGGEEVKHTGDGFFVAFDDARSAVACAAQIQETLARHRAEHGFAPRVRIGVHTARAWRSGGDYRGAGVHVAARIAAEAQGDEILASVTAIPGDVDATPPRQVRLRGLKEPVMVAAVRWSP